MKVITKFLSRIFMGRSKGPTIEERELPPIYHEGINRRHDGLLNDLGSAGLNNRQVIEALEAIEYWLEGYTLDLSETSEIALGWTSWKVTPLRKLEHDHMISRLFEAGDRITETAAEMYAKEGVGNDPL